MRSVENFVKVNYAVTVSSFFIFWPNVPYQIYHFVRLVIRSTLFRPVGFQDVLKNQYIWHIQTCHHFSHQLYHLLLCYCYFFWRIKCAVLLLLVTRVVYTYACGNGFTMIIIFGYLFSLLHDVLVRQTNQVMWAKWIKHQTVTDKLNVAISSYMSMTLKMQIAYQMWLVWAF